MNHSTYFFGNLSRGYSQFPNDYTSAIFKEVISKQVEQLQFYIKRVDNIAYYIYTRKLNNKGDVFGVCLLFNSCIFDDLSIICSILDDALKNIVLNGNIYKFEDNGDVTARTDHFYRYKNNIESISHIISLNLNKHKSSYRNLPTYNYGIDANSITKIAIEDSKDNLIKTLELAHNIVCYSSKKTEDYALSPFLEKIKLLNNTNVSLHKENAKLKAKNDELLRKKNQYIIVGILAFILFLSIIVLFVGQNDITLLRDSLSDAKSEIESKDNRISDLNNKLLGAYNNISEIIDERDLIKNNLRKTKIYYNNKLDSLKKQQVKDLSNVPFLITDIEIANTYSDGTIDTYYGGNIYSNSSMYLKPKVYYKGIDGGWYSIYVKWYSPDGTIISSNSSPNGYSQSNYANIYQGSNTVELDAWGYHEKGGYKRGDYRIEIWCKGLLLGSKTFTIY